MATGVKLKEAFEVESKHGAFYTGGNLEWHENFLYCQTLSNISVLDIEVGTVVKQIGEDNAEDADTMQTFTTDGSRTVTSHKSGLLKMWNSQGEMEKMWKYIHKGPIAALTLNEDVLASGGSDGVVRLWNLTHQACTASLRGCAGVVSVVKFHPTEKVLLASGDDGKINCYSLNNNQLQCVYSGHYSKVTCIVFHNDGKHFVSCGRDKVLILWQNDKSTAIRTLPVYESVESIASLPVKFKLPNFKPDEDGIYVASGGEKGIIRVWDISKSKEVFVQSNSLLSPSPEEGGLSIIKLLHKGKTFCVVSTEQNIIFHNLKTFEVMKQFVGFTDDILDIIYVGKAETHLAVATNSNDIKIYENHTMNCQLVRGHTDIVLGLAKSATNHELMMSCSKDNTIRIWKLELESVIMRVTCVGVGLRHTSSVGSVAFGQMSDKFAVSVSEDTCIKLWEIPTTLDKEHNLLCKFTEVAHAKDINCVAVSPNDKIIATGSQDKTAKLWSDTLTLLGALRGHRRGIWSIRFSPVDQVVATSSADCTIKLWSIADLNCLKTLEGHESSVMRLEFISQGLQLISAGGDGLIKLFNIKTSECSLTLDEHESRVWTLAIRKDELNFLTGGSDSNLIKWKDVTEARKLQKVVEDEEMAKQEQTLSNFVNSNQLLKALKLALKLDRPYQVLRIIQEVIKTGERAINETIKELRDDQKESLWKCAMQWNTNSKHCVQAQLVINILLGELQTGQFKPMGLSSTIEGSLQYTERHLKRITQMMKDMYFLNYTINCMQPHARVT